MDPDYRSEYAALYARTFASQPDTAVRLHFFKAPLAADLAVGVAKRPWLSRIRDHPTNGTRTSWTVIARSAARPRGRGSDHGRREARPASSARLCLSAAFRSCSRTRNWIGAPTRQHGCADYSAFRRGMVARRPIAAFNLMADLSLGRSRSIPSEGLTAGQLVELFRLFDLPARLYEIGALAPIFPAPPGAPTDPVPKTDANGHVLPGGLWDTRLFGTICRYLNSGLPVLVATKEHAFVLCGYRRRPRANDRDWIEFIRQDDQRGPYLGR